MLAQFQLSFRIFGAESFTLVIAFAFIAVFWGNNEAKPHKFHYKTKTAKMQEKGARTF
jgi:hypothetical protein